MNGDGTEELLVIPIEVCGTVIRGASGNGPIYVFQKKDNGWIIIGDLIGNQLKISSRKTNNYYNIETNYHMSAVSGFTHTYELKLTNKGSPSYQEVSKVPYDKSKGNNE